MAGILFEDIFDVKDIDPDGKKFERGINDSFWCPSVRVYFSEYIYICTLYRWVKRKVGKTLKPNSI